MSPVDFESPENVVLLNPRMSQESAQNLVARLEVARDLNSHVFLLTSGSTNASESAARWVALSKAAILHAAQGANTVLDSDGHDVWLHSLPDFHVGGLGIWARARLSGASVVKYASPKWSPETFLDQANSCNATLASLVPAQVHDLVEAKAQCPPTFRAILVGGGALAEPTWQTAKSLGWPLLKTYGMTETASQVATESLGGSPQLQILPHLEARTDSDGRIQVRGSSLLTAYITQGPQIFDPKDADGWYATEDLGAIDGRSLQWTGRTHDRIKIGGELVNMANLVRIFDESAAETAYTGDYALLATPDQRLESIVALAISAESPLPDTTVEHFNRRVLPFERIRRVHQVPNIPRTALGKISRGELLALLPKS